MAAVSQIGAKTYTITTETVCMPFYLLDKQSVVLMDSGFYGEREELIHTLKSNDLHVSAVLTSHAHYDHVGAHRILQKEYGALLYADPLSAGIMSGFSMLRAWFPGYTPGELESLYSFMKADMDRIFRPDCTEIVIEGCRFGVVSLPGHCFSQYGFSTEDGILYCADLLVTEDLLGNGRMIFCEDIEENLRSITRLSKMSPDRLIMAHKGYTENPVHLCEANTAYWEEQLNRVKLLADTWVSFEELCRRMAAKDYRSLYSFQIVVRIMKSLVDCLVDRGALRKRVIDNTIVFLAT